MRRSGFSLIEILLVLGMSSMILVGAMALFEQTQSKADDLRQARQAAQRLAISNSEAFALLSPDALASSPAAEPFDFDFGAAGWESSRGASGGSR